MPFITALRLGAAALVVLVARCTCNVPPLPTPRSIELSNGPTTVVIDTQPLQLRLLDAQGTVIKQSEGQDCPLVSLAIRPDDDLGDRYHLPEAPGDDLLWFDAARSTVLDERSLALALDSRDGREPRLATLRLSPGEQGFVDVDVVFASDDGDIAMLAFCLPLDREEHVVGGGERFGGVDLRGRVIPIVFRAPGPFASGTNESHVPVPFVATSSGLGLLVETERDGSFDVGATASGLQARFHGSSLPLRLRAGDIIDNVAAHARRMGLPPAPPNWVLAPMQWRNELALSLDESGTVLRNGADRLLADARRLRELNIPASTLWIDAPWETGYNNFEFNSVQFGDWRALLREVESLGYHVIVWATDNVNKSDDSGDMAGMPPYATLPLYQDFAEAGYLIQTSDGSPFDFRWGRGVGGYVDFTFDEAGRAFVEQARPIVAGGVRGFKLDYGEAMRPDLLGQTYNDLPRFHDGTSTRVQHTRHARLYHEAYLRLLNEVWPGDHFVITRSGGIYDQKNGTTIWPGDLDNDFSRHGEVGGEGRLAVGGLPAALSGLLSLAMSGYPLYGSDIGGYRGGPPSTEVLLRWAQFGALSPVMQLGGGGTGDATHNPWESRYDAGATDIYRSYARLHMDLLPSLKSWIAQSCADGTPMTVPLGVAAPHDAASWADGDSFVLGGVLLAAPVVAASRQRRVHFIAGSWLDWWNGSEHLGPGDETVGAPLERMPLYLRVGAVLWLGDPRLMTALTATDASVADPSAYGTLRVVRTSAGPDHSASLVDGSFVEQHSEAGVTRVRVRNAHARRVLIDLLLREGEGPSGQAPVSVSGLVPRAVRSMQEILSCADTCLWHAPGHLWVSAFGENLQVRFD